MFECVHKPPFNQASSPHRTVNQIYTKTAFYSSSSNSHIICRENLFTRTCMIQRIRRMEPLTPPGPPRRKSHPSTAHPPQFDAGCSPSLKLYPDASHHPALGAPSPTTRAGRAHPPSCCCAALEPRAPADVHLSAAQRGVRPNGSNRLGPAEAEELRGPGDRSFKLFGLDSQTLHSM